MDKDCFSLEMAVRDYECDLQGVVNNAVYQNYLEHARHEYLKTIGIDFAALTAQGINLVVTRIEIDYKTSLASGDRFLVEVRLERISPVRIGFRQDIYRLPDRKLAVKALVTGTALNAKGRPQLPEAMKDILDRV
ncbi:MAG: 4-hydroxybenzoyl-CoA thioesterase [Geobacteraceae bacterium GWC2_55_20]|nr:MAG: 4-hydroxybenzoyl-CoA thioesterase [Geobacteraceae bacterium GWC2_55_20]OGU18994.1 MAG: 4-hydroxybenzoyl-CoA thioesterase [Geobacteraceae bacterium GWF2_54_21]HBA71957.1 4-hydroxybenzoyl-CoA thioesterase [Geobacter sp.]HCE69007.1 4-hydroxybenzoyl-CoA thioesterase [Geobacter sp.]